MQPYLKAVGTGPRANRHLTRTEAADALGQILDGRATPVQIGAYLLGARVQGESPEELLGFLDAVRARATRITPRVAALVDVGNPYDARTRTLAISIPAACVAAAAGVPQVMHGSGEMPPKRGVDQGAILAALGVEPLQAPEAVQAQIERHGLGYYDARIFAPALYALRPARLEITLRTALNTVEKLWDLAGAPYHIIGATHAPYLPRFIGAMQGMGWARSLIVQGLEGTGDVTTGRATRIVTVTPDAHTESRLDPAALGLAPASDDLLAIPTEAGPLAHARAIRALLEGEDSSARRDVVLLNAALRVAVAQPQHDLPTALQHARAALESGAAAARLAAWAGRDGGAA